MSIAIKEAKKALLIDEVPIGCVIVYNDKIIARGFNLKENKKIVINHAEIEAIKKASKKLDNWRLFDCDLYVTIEPCLMCMGAIYQSYIKNVYFGAKDHSGGAITSSINFNEIKNLNHYPHVEGGILEEECSSLIKDYFKNKRQNKKKLK